MQAFRWRGEGVQTPAERFFVGGGYAPRDDALGLAGEHLKALRIVRARGHNDVDPLLLVQLDLVVEHLLVESVLQALVGEVDQQLLELVLRVEVLKPCRPMVTVGSGTKRWSTA